WGDVHVAGRQHGSLVLVAHATEERDGVSALGGDPPASLIYVATAGHQQPYPGPRGVDLRPGAQQDRKALARLVQPSQERQRAARTAPFGPRLGRGEPVDVKTVRDHDRI